MTRGTLAAAALTTACSVAAAPDYQIVEQRAAGNTMIVYVETTALDQAEPIARDAIKKLKLRDAERVRVYLYAPGLARKAAAAARVEYTLKYGYLVTINRR